MAVGLPLQQGGVWMSHTQLSQVGKIDACELLKQSRIFGHMRIEEYQRLLQGATIQRLEKNEVLFHRDEAARYWYIVLKGRVETLRFSQEGGELIFHQLQRGDCIAVFVMFSVRFHYPVEARAATPSLVCRISGGNLHALSARDPDLAVKLLQYASDKMYASLDSIETLTCRTVEQRLARYLLRLYTRESDVVVVPFNQRLLANQLGVRVETLNRTLSLWKKCGYLSCSRHHWRLNDIDALVRMSG